MRNVLTIARLEARLTFTASFPFLLLIAMPILVIAFLSRSQQGGAAQTVPGLLAMFGLFGVTIVGLAFFRDHGWNTWDRLRASPVGPVEMIAGKALPLLLLFALQQAIILAAGRLLFGMPWTGDIAATGLLIAAIVTVDAAMGMLVVAYCRNVEELTLAGYVGGIVFAGVGGALASLDRLPSWIGAIAPLSPVYWMERGFQVVVVGGRPVGDLLIAVGVLFGFAATMTMLAVRGFRFDAKKDYLG